MVFEMLQENMETNQKIYPNCGRQTVEREINWYSQSEEDFPRQTFDFSRKPLVDSYLISFFICRVRFYHGTEDILTSYLRRLNSFFEVQRWNDNLFSSIVMTSRETLRAHPFRWCSENWKATDSEMNHFNHPNTDASKPRRD